MDVKTDTLLILAKIIMNSQEIEVIKRIQAGEIELFEQVVVTHQDLVTRIVSGRIPNNDFAEVCQDIFLRCFKSISKFSFKSEFSHWLSKVAVRCCFDYHRRNKRKREYAVSTLTDEQEDLIDYFAADSSLKKFKREKHLHESRELLELCLTALSPEDKMLIELVYWEDWKLQDVAETLNWGLSKAKIRAMRARKKLRVELDKILEKRGN